MFRTLLLSLPVLVLGFGCSVTSVETDAGDDGSRQPLGKADNVGSCEAPDGGDYCGGPSYGNCYCDDSCEAFGDCCSDKPVVCDGEDPVEPDEPEEPVEDPQQCFIECSLTCGQAFGCDCADKCGVEEPKPEFCTTDDDCGDGDFCNTSTCVGSCPVCLDCNHVCMPIPEPQPEPDPEIVCLLECQSTCAEISGDCGCNEKCGVEQPPPPTFCVEDDSCPGDQVCDMSFCVPSCPLCQDCNFICVDP